MKRFTETQKWSDPWFMQLPGRLKLLWLWLVDNCDNSGVLAMNWPLASFQIGESVSDEDLGQMKGRIERLSDERLLILKFVTFQFGTLSEISRVHSSVIALAEKNGISDRLCIAYPKGMHTLKDKEKEKDKEKDIGERGVGKGVARTRNPLLDALVSLDGSDPVAATKPAFTRAAKALQTIREVSADVTPDEVRRRARNYAMSHPTWELTCTALAAHWSACDQRLINGKPAPPSIALQDLKAACRDTLRMQFDQEQCDRDKEPLR